MATAAQKPLTGTKVFLMLVAFFGLVIGVNVTMMKLAIDTLPGTEVDSAYSASLAYGKEITAAHEQAARKWQVEARIQRQGDGGAVVQLEARDASGRPMTGLTFKGTLERPIDKRADRPVELSEVGIGIYRGSASAVAAGQWDLVIEADARGQRMFQSRNRVILN
ncbi:FixH family protein [Bradyrhizobium liaoningense]|uniref:FixH family protein n=1 Tax=Bradyrhizobium liaoningense TaxID=43992 RepID=UPI001BA5150B|nr:FixH family protein [Bradyrhizobium liaoningense]MBR0714255.1 FixH family protein [Bradyrhizobium liaoningense]